MKNPRRLFINQSLKWSAFGVLSAYQADVFSSDSLDQNPNPNPQHNQDKNNSNISSEIKGKTHHEAIKLIVPFAAGGSSDWVARQLSKTWSDVHRQNLIVDNRAGAAGSIGTQWLLKSPSDGFTLGLGTVSTLAVNSLLLPSAQFDPLNDLTPIAALAQLPSVFVVNPSMNVRNFSQFIHKVQQNPDFYTCATPGIASIGHLILSAMNQQMKLQLRHIPYKSMSPAINAVLSGEISMLSDQYPSSAPHIARGKLIPIAVAAHKRLPDLPSVPTLRELGFGDLNQLAMTWFGLIAPSGLDSLLQKTLHQKTQAVLQNARLREQWKSQSIEFIDNAPIDVLTQWIKQSLIQTRRYAHLLKES